MDKKMPSVLFDEVQGDDWSWNLQMLKDDSDVPISGLFYASAKIATLRRFAGDTNFVITTSAVTVTDDVNGLVTVDWASVDTTKAIGGFYWCEIRFDGVGGKRKTAGPFAVSVRSSVT